LELNYHMEKANVTTFEPTCDVYFFLLIIFFAFQTLFT